MLGKHNNKYNQQQSQQEKREQGFNAYVSGANNEKQTKQYQKQKEQRELMEKAKNVQRKAWEKKPMNDPYEKQQPQQNIQQQQYQEFQMQKQQQYNQYEKPERKKWVTGKSIQQQQYQQNNMNNDDNYNNIEEQIQEEPGLQNYIENMNQNDIQMLAQSLRQSQIFQQTNNTKNNQQQKIMENNSIQNIEEDIQENIQENDSPQKNFSPSKPKLNNIPLIMTKEDGDDKINYFDKKAQRIKPRPISAAYVQNNISNNDSNNYQQYQQQDSQLQQQYSSLQQQQSFSKPNLARKSNKSIELNYQKNQEIIPKTTSHKDYNDGGINPKEFQNPFHKKPIRVQTAQPQKYSDNQPQASFFKKQPSDFYGQELQLGQNMQGNPHYKHLLQRISKLDQSKISQLEQIVEKIELGHLDINSLLQLEFLFKNKSDLPPKEQTNKQDLNKNQKESRSEIHQKQQQENQKQFGQMDTFGNFHKKKSAQKQQDQDNSDIDIDDDQDDDNNQQIFGEYGEEEIRPETIKLPQQQPQLQKKWTQDSFGAGDQEVRPDTIKFVPPQPIKSKGIINMEQTLDSINDKTQQQSQSQQQQKFIQFGGENSFTLIIKIISTWGSQSIVGLTQINVYDCEGQTIHLDENNIFLNNPKSKSLKNIENILDGYYNTLDSSHMWNNLMPDPPKCLEIGIHGKSRKGIGALKIWNYNKSLAESSKGIKEVEVLLNQQQIWSGNIKRGTGELDEDYGTLVFIDQNLKEQYTSKIKQKQNQDGDDDIILPKINEPLLEKQRPKNSDKIVEPKIIKQDSVPYDNNNMNRIQEENTPMPSTLYDENINNNTQDNNNKSQYKSKLLEENHIPKILGEVPQDNNTNQKQQQKQEQLLQDQSQQQLYPQLNSEQDNLSQNKSLIKNNISQLSQQKQLTPKKRPQTPTKLKDSILSNNKSLLQNPQQNPSLVKERQLLGSGRRPQQSQNSNNNKQTTLKHLNQQLQHSHLTHSNISQQQQPQQQQSQANESFLSKKEYNINDYRPSQIFKKNKEKQPSDSNNNTPSNSQNNQQQQQLQEDQQQQLEKSYVSQLKDSNNFMQIPDSVFRKSMQQSKLSQQQQQKNKAQPKVAWNKFGDGMDENFSKTFGDNKSNITEKNRSKIVSAANPSHNIQQQQELSLEEKIKQQEELFKIQKEEEEKKFRQIQLEEQKKREEEEKIQQERIRKMEEQIQRENEQKEKLKQQKLQEQREKELEQKKIQQQRELQIQQDLQAQQQLQKLKLNNDKQQQQNDQKNSQKIKFKNNDDYLAEILQDSAISSSQQQQKPKKNNKVNFMEESKQEEDRNLLKQFEKTNEGRLQPQERKKQMQNEVLDLQNLVQNSVQQIEKNVSQASKRQQQNISQYHQQQQNQNQKNSNNNNNDYIEKFFKDELKMSGLFDDKFFGSINLKNKATSSISPQKPKQQKQQQQQKDFNNNNSILSNNSNISKMSYIQQKKMEMDKKRQEEEAIQQQNLKNQSPQKGLLQSQKNQQQQDQFHDQSVSKLLDEIENIGKEDVDQQEEEEEEEYFEIPNLPQGRYMQISIYSTWGDKFYVGLNGLEFYDDNGEEIKIKDIKKQISAEPSDINILPQYENDPRVCQNLVDGTYYTRDDLHVWLAPFQTDTVNQIWVDFLEVKKLSFIRIWNYNKSRIHSFRGAKDIKITLDKQIIFQGEIQKSPGQLSSIEKHFEGILFTDNESTIEYIQTNDWVNDLQIQDVQSSNHLSNNNSQIYNNERPRTGNKQDLVESMLQDQEGRPLTIVNVQQQMLLEKQQSSNKNQENLMKSFDKMDHSKSQTLNIKANKKLNQKANKKNIKKIKKGIKCKKLIINIKQSWGDQYYVGLSGLQIYDQNQKLIDLKPFNLDARPKDMNSIKGHAGDKRILSNLINTNNVTQNDDNMWLVPYIQGQNHFIYIDFKMDKIISGIKFFNYNKSQEDVLRGAKLITIQKENNQYLTPESGVIIRKAPGTDLFDYGQLLSLPYQDGWNEQQIESMKAPQQILKELVQEYDVIHMPGGMSFRINILSTYGDIHYAGLNGIEIYDYQGNPIIKSGQQVVKIAAEPSSVNIIAGQEKDIRTIDKLVNGENDTYDDTNMWLTPFVSLLDQDKENKKVNTIYLQLEKPILISAIAFWNYSKTPARGAKEIEIFLDDQIIYKGYLRKAPTQNQFKDKNMPLNTTILFNKSPQTVQKIQPQIYTEDNLQQAVQMYNEKKDVTPKNRQQNIDEPNRNIQNIPIQRPSTKVGGGNFGKSFK